VFVVVPIGLLACEIAIKRALTNRTAFEFGFRHDFAVFTLLAAHLFVFRESFQIALDVAEKVVVANRTVHHLIPALEAIDANRHYGHFLHA
jgi:hypothetical protein